MKPAVTAATAGADAPAAFRQRALDALVAPLRDGGALAVFEGGSAATGRLDAFSDIDLCIVVAELAQAEAMFGQVQAALQVLTPIEHQWTVDPVPFAHMAQRFYLLRDAPPYFAIDCAVLAPAGLAQFAEVERHGTPRVYFDPQGLVRSAPLDRPAHQARLARRRGQIAQSARIFALLARKELARGRPLEALGFHQALVRALVDLLGMRHRPERFDFGLRYVTSDFPAAAQALVADAAFVPDADALRERIDRAEAAIHAELATPLPHPNG